MNDKLLSFLGIAMRAGSIVFGMDEVKKNILKNKIKLILTANDISDNSYLKIQKFSVVNNIEFLKIKNTKDDINMILGKYSAILGIKDINFANKIKSIVQEDYILNKH